MSKYSKEYAIWYEQLKQDYIDQYFYGEQDLFMTQSQPFISFRHLFMKHLYHDGGHSLAEIARLEGLDTTTVRNSLETSNIKVSQIEQESVAEFMIGRMAKDPLTRVRLTLQTEQGTTDEVAKKYDVHFTVIDKIMNQEPVAPNTINFLYRQCYV